MTRVDVTRDFGRLHVTLKSVMTRTFSPRVSSSASSSVFSSGSIHPAPPRLPPPRSPLRPQPSSRPPPTEHLPSPSSSLPPAPASIRAYVPSASSTTTGASSSSSSKRERTAAAAGVTRREKLARFSPAEEASLRSRPRRLDAESPRRDRLEDLEASPRAGGGCPRARRSASPAPRSNASSASPEEATLPDDVGGAVHALGEVQLRGERARMKPSYSERNGSPARASADASHSIAVIAFQCSKGGRGAEREEERKGHLRLAEETPPIAVRRRQGAAQARGRS